MIPSEGADHRKKATHADQGDTQVQGSNVDPPNVGSVERNEPKQSSHISRPHGSASGVSVQREQPLPPSEWAKEKPLAARNGDIPVAELVMELCAYSIQGRCMLQETG